MSEPQGALIWCPFGDRDSASQVAGQLLDERLIACANILPDMQSLYLWKGKRGDSRECGVLLKTEASTLDRAVERLAELHPYEDPAIIGWHCDAASPATLAWLAQETGNAG
ncbi:MAG: divalent-cation tolerance protein CutA [Novosphingobium sp.]